MKCEIAQGRYNLRRDTKSPKFEEFAKVYLEYSKANKRSYETDITLFKACLLSLKDTSYQKSHPF